MHGHDLILKNRGMIAPVLANGVMIEIGSDRETGSTSLLANMAKEYGASFITVDPDTGANSRAKGILSKIDPSFTAVNDYGEKFLEKYTGTISVVYLDAFDIVLPHWPHIQSTIDTYEKRNQKITNRAAWKMHFEATEHCLDKMCRGGFICLDDTWKTEGMWDGKGRIAVPYLLGNGYGIVDIHDQCVLFKKEA